MGNAAFAVLLLRLLPQQPASPLSPEDALKSFTFAKELRIELVACEPQTSDPVAVAWDEDGRMYVAEMGDYPLGPPGGRVRLLEDLDGDGRIDRSTVFVDNLPFPTGVMPWKGGVLVTAAPDILFFKDTDGDRKADHRQVVITGFRRGNQQHNVNGLVYGIDNWIYGANGDSGGGVRFSSKPDAKPVSINGLDFRFRIDTGEVEGVAGQSQFANTFDAWGNRFFNNNSNHIRHAPIALPYLRRNPHLSVPQVTDEISDHGPGGRVFPSSKLEARFNDLHTANHFTSACSVTIYLGGALEGYEGNAFTCEPVHNLVHRDLLERKGASFVARRAEKDSDFLTSTDGWFRPVNVATGPDGALYVVDMYRAVIEHPQWIPLETQKRINLRAGEDRGRIYRIVPAEGLKSARPALSVAKTEELVNHLESPNAWWRNTAQRLLVDRKDKAAIEPLTKLVGDIIPRTRLHALCTLDGMGDLSDTIISRRLADPNSNVRIQLLRLAERHLPDSPALASRLRQMLDPDPSARFQYVLTLGSAKSSVDPQALAQALAPILQKDVGDRWMRIAALSSVGDSAVELLYELRARRVHEQESPGVNDFVRQLAALVGARRNEDELVNWLKLAVSESPAQPHAWQLAAVSAVTRKGLDTEALLKKAGADIAVANWTAHSEAILFDATREAPERLAALDLLATLRPTVQMAEKIEKLIRPQEPSEVQVAIVRALAAWPGDPFGAKLMDGWASRSTAVRREILNAVFTKAARIDKMLDLLEKGGVRITEMEPHHRNQLQNHPSAAIRQRARKLLDAGASVDRQQLIELLTPKVLDLKGDPVRGEKVYQSNCATCHRWHGQGMRVGPGLETVGGRDKGALLVDLLDPSRFIDPAYQTYVIKTAAGEFSGVIAAELPHSVTLRRAGGEESTVLRKDIIEMKAWPASLMTEGIENNVKAQEFADLLEFLSPGGNRPGRKVFDGNAPAVVKPAADSSLTLAATQCEIYGPTIVFEAKYKNLGFWHNEGDRAVWTAEVAKAGKYAVELDWACEDGTAGGGFALEVIGGARLTGKVAGTGTWDVYRKQKLGAIELKAGKQELTFRSDGRVSNALIDLRSIRLIPEE